MTIGDVFAVVAGVIAICAAGWALLMSMTLIFASKATTARDYLQESPRTSFGVGLVLVLTLGFFSIMLINHPHGLLKLVGWATLLSLLSLSSLGTGGLALLLNERIRGLEPEMPEFKSLCRGATLLVMAGLTPLLGWFVFTPLVIVTALGTGARVIMQRETKSVPLPATFSAPAPSVPTQVAPALNYAYPAPTQVSTAPLNGNSLNGNNASIGNARNDGAEVQVP